jgi:hypothetical protein
MSEKKTAILCLAPALLIALSGYAWFGAWRYLVGKPYLTVAMSQRLQYLVAHPRVLKTIIKQVEKEQPMNPTRQKINKYYQ